MTERLQALGEIEAAIWRTLQQAVHERGHPWRTPVLATAAEGRADARVLVLREVDPGAGELVFFTDARSPKIAQVAAAPQGLLVMWSPALNWQLRLGVALEAETSGLAVSSHWARLKLTRAAQDYLAAWPPGTELADVASGDDSDAPEAVPPPSPTAPEWASRSAFALLRARVQRIDWLELHPAGHRRAVFDPGRACWVQP